MNDDTGVSAFLLERYHLGEVTPQEKLHVETTLGESALSASLAELDRADQDFLNKFPANFITQERMYKPRLPASYYEFPCTRRPKGGIGAEAQRKREENKGRALAWKKRRKILVWGLSAAALALILPLFVLRNFIPSSYDDRLKGSSVERLKPELSVYLKGNSAGAETKLRDQAGIRTGNTVQLAYKVQGEDSGERYGVIFSIDGRSSVTLHYPYTAGQSTRLVSGKAVPLEEAYTLDDAPDYEIFFFVVGDKPLKTEDVLNTAKNLAGQIAGNPQKAERQGSAAFKDHGVKTLTLWKN